MVVVREMNINCLNPAEKHGCYMDIVKTGVPPVSVFIANNDEYVNYRKFIVTQLTPKERIGELGWRVTA